MQIHTDTGPSTVVTAEAKMQEVWEGHIQRGRVVIRFVFVWWGDF